MGDLDGDGVNDVVVGAVGDDTGGSYRGAVHVLLLNADGTAKSSTKIAHETNGGPTLSDNDRFGFAAAFAGDLDGDGAPALIVGANTDSTGGPARGAVHVLFLESLNGSPTVSLPDGGGEYEILISTTDLVVRFTDGAELFRQSAASVSSLLINGSPDADIVTVLDSGGTVPTPILFLGGDGNDRFDGSLATGTLQLVGFGGDDTLVGGSGHDSLIGESGFDVVVLRAASITATDTNLTADGQTDGIHSVEGLLLVASASGSTIDASEFTSGPVTLIGSAGPDTLTGGSGDDLILAGGGRDLVSGGEGNDLVTGNSGDDTLIGDGGDDTLIGGRGRDSINGEQGADQLRGGSGPDSISGGDDDDHIRGDGGRDVLDGDDGPDTILGGGGRDNLAGGLGIDSLNGTIRDDTFSEQVGPDFQFGGIRSQARPAPARTESESAEPQTGIQHPESESAEEIDEAFSPSLLPTLLQL
ncbi:MAG: Ca2+-binding RTX toxin-like protein [Planctomycetaceae bacterium]|jgi:Ca2+-binding RTX toxin-like protein